MLLFHNQKSVFGKEKNITPKDGKGTLLNTSDVSRSLAEGSMKPFLDSKEKENITVRGGELNVKLLFALSRLYGIVLSRWGGNGGEDIVRRPISEPTGTPTFNQIVATSKSEPCVLSLLNVLCFSTPFVRTAWALIQSDQPIYNQLHDITDASKK